MSSFGLIKRSVSIAGHATSVTLEPEFWALLKQYAQEDGQSLRALISDIDSRKTGTNLSSAIRVYILKRACANGEAQNT